MIPKNVQNTRKCTKNRFITVHLMTRKNNGIDLFMENNSCAHHYGLEMQCYTELRHKTVGKKCLHMKWLFLRNAEVFATNTHYYVLF